MPDALSPIELADALDPSPLVPRYAPVDAIARPFRPATADDTFECVQRMTSMIFQEFVYKQNVSDVATTVEQTIAGRKGVCQDFAHLLIALCRALGIPARYVSGYLVVRDRTQGDAHGRAPSRGADASHAWVEVFTQTHGWRGFDPTNNLVANEFYVKVAIGRDYSDVPPTRGTYHGAAHEQLSVTVTAQALE